MDERPALLSFNLKAHCNLTRPIMGLSMKTGAMLRFFRDSGKRLLVFVMPAVLLTGCGEPPPPGELAFGQEPYLRYCASCHGNQGQGKPPTFPPMANSEWLELGNDALGLIVLYGLRGEIEVAGQTYRGYMPPMQHISDADIAALLTYINTTWGPGDAPMVAEEVSRLRGVFDGPRSPLNGYDGLIEALDAANMDVAP